MIKIEMVDAIGKPAMYEQLAEEAGELAHAAQKMARILRGENPTSVTEEEARRNLVEEFTDTMQSAIELNLGIDAQLAKEKRKRFWERWEEKDDTRIAERSVAIRKSKAIRPLYEIDLADLVHPVKEWRYPTCDSFYGEPLMKWSYCPCCGQHIDWTDETILKWRKEHGKRTL